MKYYSKKKSNQMVKIAKMNIDNIVGQLRCHGYTQTLLAVELNVSVTLINRVIHGKTKSKRIQQKIADIIGEDIETIWPK